MSNCEKPAFKWLDAIAGVVIYALWCVLVTAVFAALLVTGGCAVLPDTVSLDAAHTSHHWGDTRAPYEFGKDTEGVSEHWNAGPLKLDLSEYYQQCKDGNHPEFNARASYVIPLPK